MKRIGTIAALLSAAAVSAFAYGVADNGSSSTIRAEGPVITEERAAAPFKSVALEGSGVVRYKRADRHRVTVRTAESLMDRIVTEVSGGELVLKFKPGTRISGDAPIEFLVEAPELTSLRIAGSGNFSSEDLLRGDALSFEITGSGSVTAEVSAGSVAARISGSGSIELSGKTESLEYRNSGSGVLKAADLAAERAEVRITGAGSGTVNAASRLRVDIAGSGSVFYKGSPKLEFSGSGSGRVAALN